MSDPSSGGSNSSSGGAGMIGTALGGIGKAIGGFEQGQATQAMYDYQAGIANLNAQISYQNAEYSIQTGEHQAMQAGIQGMADMGKIKAAQGASGLDVNTGSAKDVQKSEAEITGMNMTTIRSNAAKTAYNYTVQGVGFGAQAQLDKAAGQGASTAGMINAASSIVSSASSVSSEWQRGSLVWLVSSPGGGNTLSPQSASIAPQGGGTAGGADPYQIFNTDAYAIFGN